MTKLSVLLNRYDQSALTEKILGEGIDPFSYMTIDSDENGFLISPTPLLLRKAVLFQQKFSWIKIYYRFALIAVVWNFIVKKNVCIRRFCTLWL